MEHHNDPFDHYVEKGSNIALGIAIGFLIAFCLVVYVVASIIIL
jgi:tetrahydromethanopterin S-methyltransferase subunit F